MERENRLRRRADFARVRAGGTSYPHRLMILAVVPNGLQLCRFGFITGRRVGNAVRRNRVRRLMREAVRKNLAHIVVGWDCVLIAREPLASLGLPAADGALVQLLRTANLWRSTPAEDRQACGKAGR